MSNVRKLTKSEERLLAYFRGIEDDTTRDLLIDVIVIERAHRSSTKFPIKRIREKVDSYARYIEKEMGE